MEGKRDKTRFVFEAGGNYVKYQYFYKKDSGYVTLRYRFMNGELEIEDANDKALKQKKVKEKGTYQVGENNIVFVTSNDRYSAQYRLEGKTLLLTFTDDSLSNRAHTLKFKRY